VKFNKEQHQFISEAVRNYIQHLELINYADVAYIGELRSFLGKLLRESDWSYILWTSPKNGLAGKVKIVNSSCSDFPRKSNWKLYQNGTLKQSSLFSSRKINLMEFLTQIQSRSDTVFALNLNNNDILEVEAEPSSIPILKSLGEIAAGSAFRRRTTPQLIILDSTAFYLEKNKGNSKATAELTKIINALIPESYGLKPKHIKYASPEQDKTAPESGRVKLEIWRESLIFLEKALCEYCDMIGKSSSADQDLAKIEKAKKLAEIFRKANS